MNKIEIAKQELAKMKRELLEGCLNMQFNVCDACQSKKECCELAFEAFGMVH